MVGRKPPSMNRERAHTEINQKHQPASQRMQDCEQIMFSEVLCHLLHQYFLHQFLSIHCARAPYSSKSFALCTSKFPNGAARRSSDTMKFNEYYYESFIDAILHFKMLRVRMNALSISHWIDCFHRRRRRHCFACLWRIRGKKVVIDIIYMFGSVARCVLSPAYQSAIVAFQAVII